MPTKTTERGVKEQSMLKLRRQRVIKRLEAQLKSGKKNGVELHAKEPNGFHYVPAVLSLSEGDIKRINKELATLKSRI